MKQKERPTEVARFANILYLRIDLTGQSASQAESVNNPGRRSETLHTDKLRAAK